MFLNEEEVRIKLPFNVDDEISNIIGKICYQVYNSLSDEQLYILVEK